MVKVSQVYIVAGVAVLAAGAYVYMKGAGNVARSLGSAAVDMVDGVVAGTVETLGEKIGVPKTDISKCQADKAAGNTWAASFDCSASEFASYLWN